MSSMDRISLYLSTIVASTAIATSTPGLAQQPERTDLARNQLVAQAPQQIGLAVDRWQMLTTNDRLGFEDYAGFVLAYPNFPREEVIRRYAEQALDRDAATPERIVAFFTQNPPLTNSGRARYALALAALNRPGALEVAREAWRGGEMSGTTEAYMLGLYGTQFTPADHDARMNALLWQGQAEAAARQAVRVSPAYRDSAMARLALLNGSLPEDAGLPVPTGWASDPGYVYNLVRHYRKTGQPDRAVSVLAMRPRFSGLPVDAQDFVTEMLIHARNGNAREALRIAASVDDLFAPGADISGMGHTLRDDYTSLVWHGGTEALWKLGDGKAAASLFYRYGNAARTPQTRSKGFYWAGLASARAGDMAEANRYFEMAAAYPEYFYGLLALERLGREPAYRTQPIAIPTPQERAEFASLPLVQAVQTVSRGGTDWRTARYFYSALADWAPTEGQMVLVAELANTLNLPELAVVIGRTAPEKGFDGFTAAGFPTVDIPGGSNWTMVHAIARQESEFDETRTSHAGATGLMQLMPATAREQAGKLGMNYMSARLTSPDYNATLGNAYFARMLDYYDGSFPLAVAAYNAGPGNVNKWLRSNGDPRNGNIEWLRWIEEIPFFETKNYVHRVIENAAVYERLYPDKSRYGTPRGVSQFLGRTPG